MENKRLRSSLPSTTIVPLNLFCRKERLLIDENACNDSCNMLSPILVLSKQRTFMLLKFFMPESHNEIIF